MRVVAFVVAGLGELAAGAKAHNYISFCDL